MNMEVSSGGEVRKYKKTILRKEKLKERKEKKKRLVEVRKTDEREALREITVKIRLKRIDIYEGITVEALLNSGTIRGQ